MAGRACASAMLAAVFATFLVVACAEPTTVNLYPNSMQVLPFVAPEGASNGTLDLLLTANVADGEDITLRCQPRSTDDRTVFPWVSSLPSGATERLHISSSNPAFAAYPDDAGSVMCQVINEGQPPREASVSINADWLLDGMATTNEAEQVAMEQILQDCCSVKGSCEIWKQTMDDPEAAANYCQLPGMVCDAEGHFVQISFDGYNLSCALPSELFAEFGSLRTLAIAEGHNLKGDLEKVLFDLSSLKGLEALQLANSPGLAGQLSNEPLLGPLCALAEGSLKVLDLRNVSAQGQLPECLIDVRSKLQFLHLGYNQLTGPVPDVFSRASSLTWLTVNDNQLSGQIPASLGKLTHLYMLNITSNELTGPLPSSLGDIKYLMHILARNNHINGTIPDSIAMHQRLITIDLRNNIVSGMPAAWFDMSPRNVATLRALNLQALRFANNSFEGPIPPGLEAMGDLLDLNLAVNKFSGELPSNMTEGVARTTFPNMLLFNVSRNQLNGSIPESYGKDMRMFTQPTSEVPGRGGAVRNWTFIFDVSDNNFNGSLPTFLENGTMHDGQQAWIDVNLTSSGTWVNSCDEQFAWTSGACTTGVLVTEDDEDGDDEVTVDDEDDESVQRDFADAAGTSTTSGGGDDGSSDNEDDSGGLSVGAIVGIVIGSVVGVVLLALVVVAVLKRGGGKGPIIPAAVSAATASKSGRFEKFTEAAPAPAKAANGNGVDTVVPSD